MAHLKFTSLRRDSFMLDGMESVAKDADSVDPYTIDWSEDLAAAETISTSAWEYSVVTGASATNTTTTTTTTISGTGGWAKNTITTSLSRTLVHRVGFVDVED